MSDNQRDHSLDYLIYDQGSQAAIWREVGMSEPIHFNIWDDYDEDEGTTYGYVEEDEEKFSDDQKEEIVSLVAAYIKENLDLGEATCEATGFDLDLGNLSYDRLERLVEEMEKSGLTYKGQKILFYSES